MAGWGSLADVLGETFNGAGLPSGRLDLPAAPLAPPPPPPAPGYPGTTPQESPYPAMPWPPTPPPAPAPASGPVLTGDQLAKLTYMGVDPKTASPQEIERILGLGTPAATPPPAAPPPQSPAPDNTDPRLNNPPPPDPASTPDPAEPAGKAADAASADGKQVQAILDELAGLDKSSATTLDQIHAAGVEGRKQLDSIQTDVETKIQQLGPQLNTPQGQQQLRDFLKEKLAAAKKIIDQHIADAEDAARKTHESINKYADLGTDNKPDTTGDASTDAPAANPPPAATEPAAATPAVTAPAGATPMMSPMGGMPGMPMGGMPSMGGIPMPSFGGGGTPGMGGGGDPFSDGQGTPHGEPAAFHDNQPADSAGSDVKAADFHDPKADQADSSAHNGGSGHGSDPSTQPATSPDSSAAQHNTDTLAGAHDDNKGTDVKLPDGSLAHARNSQEAIAARAAVGGATVGDAYKSAGVDLPPAGTPVTDPLPPQLKAGDVGVWKDHLVMALGDGKVLVNGQIQPQDSLGSGPDFLGWIDPTKHAATPASPAPPPAAAAPSVPS
jgi:hypothetical protein